MLKQFVASVAIAAFLAAPALAQKTKHLQTVTKKGTELVIPFKKYQLANGLTVVVHEDNSDPVVHVDVTYHVGSAREEIGKSGFAHFFEHMMFQGSDNVGDEQHFKFVSEAGGSLNGTTNRDRTNYFETLPSNQLETALWLEADRMGFLLDAVTQRKFEIQRETVKNERGQRYDNAPYGLAGETTSKALYPYGHPYSWLTIGYIEDLNRVDVNDLKNFFLRWYGPNNAVLTVGGDVKAEEVVKLAEKYFGSIPKGPEVKNMPAMPARLDKDRFVSYEDNVRLPMLRVTYPGAPQFSKDEAALDALAFLLGTGKNSPLYKDFVVTQKASQAYAYHWGSELAGEFALTVMAFPNTSLVQTHKELQNTLAEFEKKGVSQTDLNRFIATTESDFINGLASVQGKVSRLAAYQTFTGDANYFGKNLARYTSLTPADVMTAYNTYIKGKPSVTLSVVPKGKPELAASTENYVVSTQNFKPGPNEYKGLKYNKAKDKFDRSKKPAAGKNPVVNVPAFWTNELKNGVKMIGSKNDEIPTVAMQIKVRGGQMLDAKAPEKAGLAQLTARMMNEGTNKYSAEQFEEELEKLGSDISVYPGSEEITITVESLSKNLDKTLALLEERLLHPKFDQEAFDRLKKQQIEAIENQGTQPVTIANNAYKKVLYGNSHIFGTPQMGTVNTVKNLSLADVQNFYNQYFSPSVTNVVVVGDIEKDKALAKLSFLDKWQNKPVALPQFTQTPAIDKTKIYLVNKDNAPQSEIRIGYMAMPYDATGDYFKTGLMNHSLGGDFNSRINLNLREDKGWTYGARTGFNGTKLAGPFTAAAGVRANATDSAVYEFIREMKGMYEQGLKDEEVAFMRSAIGQADARKYETPLQKAAFLGQIIEYDLPKDFTAQRNQIIKEIKKEELNALAKKHLDTNKMAIVVVGDKKLVLPGLQKLGYDIVELDAEGNVLAN